ncbi:nitrogen fixation protein NifQ [Vibrio viridaestus]|uniref:Nitrogen fixation protein NifQ n=1 Tax=Vibrio viridaestus TaxID=2487322 RepID=A0A3N9TD72_9VIBR|nr:nitrogen fixation protein NifQ [Vibrio viridaestus]RQW62121.1 nitrogen fixation protein NifQ [Vibrio viridaestus]
MIDEYDASSFWIPILTSYLAGGTCLPPYLGLSQYQFEELCSTFQIKQPDNYDHVTDQRLLLAELSGLRLSEQKDLSSLLFEHLNKNRLFAEEMAHVLTLACMGTQHLWKDIGMPQRPLLTQLFGYFFPQLREMNDKNMRWKRFLYRQLCSSGGDYVCRSPSCETCTSFSECFIDE